MFQLFGERPKRKRFSLSHGFHLRCAIGHDARNFRHLSKPATVVFQFGFKCQVHERCVADAAQKEYSQLTIAIDRIDTI